MPRAPRGRDAIHGVAAFNAANAGAVAERTAAAPVAVK
jgi:hypothetical protein